MFLACVVGGIIPVKANFWQGRCECEWCQNFTFVQIILGGSTRDHFFFRFGRVTSGVEAPL